MIRMFGLLALTTILGASGCCQFDQRRAADQANKQNTLRASDSAPTVHTVGGNFSKIVVVRLKYGTDLLDGLRQAVEREKIRNAVILSGIGSLTSYHVHVVDSTTFPVKEAFPKAEGPQDLLNVNGYVIDGRVHAHVTFSDEEQAMGGHLEPGTKVLTFAIITLGIFEHGASLARFDDWKW